MLKVIIADDEYRVCQLINALCDWKSLGLEVAGMAHDGLEALEMVRRERPDILITDIRMPGCDGLELIRQVREAQPSIEVLVLSGYTNFEYAQTAIRNGVSDYLLKPIDEDELHKALVKLRDNCLRQHNQQLATEQLREHLKIDESRRRAQFFSELLLAESRPPVPGLAGINEAYHFKLQEGLFRVCILKLDYDPSRYGAASVKIIFRKAEELLRPALSPLCTELELYCHGSRGYLLCGFAPEQRENLRRALRDVLIQSRGRKMMAGDILMSIGAGTLVDDAARLRESLDWAEGALKERLIYGAGTLLENCPAPGEPVCEAALKRCEQELSPALDLLDAVRVSQLITQFRQGIRGMTDLTGRELQDSVTALGVWIISHLQETGRVTLMTEFRGWVDLCGTQDALFVRLEQLAASLIEQRAREQKEQQRAPIRAAKKYILDHFAEPITLAEVAAVSNFNAVYFSGLFKKETGCGFSEFLTQTRMDRAKELLRDTPQSVADICQQVGYSDPKHFSHTFRKYTGLKPSEFRKLYG